MCADYLATLDRDELMQGLQALREDLDESKQEKRHFRKLYEEAKKRLAEVESERDVYQQYGLTLEQRLEAAEAETTRLLHELEATRPGATKRGQAAEPQIKRSRSPSLELIERPAATQMPAKTEAPAPVVAKAQVAAQSVNPAIGAKSQVVRGHTLQKRKASSSSTATRTAKKPRASTSHDSPQVPMQTAAAAEGPAWGIIQDSNSDDDEEYVPEEEGEPADRSAKWKRDKATVVPELELERYKISCKRCSEIPGQKCYKQKSDTRGPNYVKSPKLACFGCYLRKQACSHSSGG